MRRLLCQYCGLSKLVNEEDISKLIRIPRCPVFVGKDKPYKELKELYKCPQCGRGVSTYDYPPKQLNQMPRD